MRSRIPKLEATGQKKDSDRAYLKALDSEISRQTQTLRAQFQSEIVALRARVAESDSLSEAKKALVDRQSTLVARNAASMDMLNPTKAQYSAALHNADVERAKLNQKAGQLANLSLLQLRQVRQILFGYLGQRDCSDIKLFPLYESEEQVERSFEYGQSNFVLQRRVHGDRL